MRIKLRTSAQDNNSVKNYLIIFHDVGLKLDGQTNRIVKDTSAGHFYLGLTDNENFNSYGFNPINLLNAVIGRGIVRNENDRLELAERFKNESGEDVLHNKTIPLSHDQYHIATKHIALNWSGESLYEVGKRDCVYFVQDVYHCTGMSLYFTKVFIKSELLGLGTPVVRSVLERYGSRDTIEDRLSRVKSESKEILARELNIAEHQIKNGSWQVSFTNYHYDSDQTTLPFSIVLNDNDLKSLYSDNTYEGSTIHIEYGNDIEEISTSFSNVGLAGSSGVNINQLSSSNTPSTLEYADNPQGIQENIVIRNNTESLIHLIYNNNWKKFIKIIPTLDLAIINKEQGVLHAAIEQGADSSIIRLLLDKGVDVNVFDDEGLTPLHNAAWNGCRLDILELLIQYKADPLIKDSLGRTLLHYAAACNASPESLKLLMDQNIDLNAKDNENETALEVAIKMSSNTVIEFLENYTHVDHEAGVPLTGIGFDNEI